MHELPEIVPTADSLPDLMAVASLASLPECGEDDDDELPPPPLDELEATPRRAASDGEATPRRPSSFGGAFGAGGSEDDDPDWISPWISIEKGKAYASSAQIAGYHTGKCLKYCHEGPDSSKTVDAIVTDSHGDEIKIIYSLGGRWLKKVLSASEISGDTTAYGGLAPCVGAPVMVRSTSVNAWFKGTVLSCEGSFAKVHWWHNGQSCTKILPKTSPDLQVCFRKMPGLSMRCPAVSGEAESL